jgi:hypothetical protein
VKQLANRGKTRNKYRIWLEASEEETTRDLGVDRRIILKQRYGLD